MAIHVFDQPQGWTFDPITDRFHAALARLTRRYERWQRCRTIEAELGDYTPDQLVELGITEADVEWVALEGSRDLTEQA